MTTRDCTHGGHCFHRPDGSLHERHAGNPPGTAKVTCCDCATTAIVPTHARHTQRSLVGATRTEHGPYVPKPDPSPTAA